MALLALALDDQATNDWRVRLHDVSTDLLLGVAYRLAKTQLPVGGGTLNGTITCKGAWRQAETDTDLVATAPKIEDEPLERVDIRATTKLPRWTLYADAVRTPERARDTPRAAGEPAIASTNASLLELYRAGRTIREATRP